MGTGGKSHYPFGTIQPNSQVRNADTNGVIRLTLHPGNYEWRFLPEAGKNFTDSGSDQCHGVPGNADTTAPTVSTVAPTDRAMGVAVTTNAEAAFPEAMDPATVTGSTFTLTKQGSSQPVGATVSYDQANKKATLDPTAISICRLPTRRPSRAALVESRTLRATRWPRTRCGRLQRRLHRLRLIPPRQTQPSLPVPPATQVARPARSHSLLPRQDPPSNASWMAEPTPYVPLPRTTLTCPGDLIPSR